jgi:uncharacterized membrane protein
VGSELIGLLLAGVVLTFVLVTILTLVNLVRIGKLEREVARLKAEWPAGGQVAPAAAAPRVAPAAPSVPSAAPVIAAPVPDAAVAAAPAAASPSAMFPPPLPPATITDRGFDWETLIAGRWLQRIGLVAVAIGVAYFLKEAIDNDWIGPSGQVALGILLGAALLAGSEWLRRRNYGFFAEGLTGLGVVVLYLSIWAGGSYYHLFPLQVAFLAMVIVTAGTIAMAIGRDSQRIAVLGLLGGFMTPVLVSTGQDAPVSLFSYIAVLNAGLLPIAWFRRWRWLELPAFFFTQIYFWAWYSQYYNGGRLPLTVAFATLFAAQFLALPVLRSRRAGTLGVEQMVLIPLNAGLYLLALHDMMFPARRWTLTIATLALAAVHLVVARAVPRRQDGIGVPALVFGGVALTLITLAIPIRLEGRWIALAWAIEGAVLAWTGFRARVPAMRAMALVVLGIVVLIVLVEPEPATRFLFNRRLLTDLVSVAAIGSALWFARAHRDQIGPTERLPFQILALAVNVIAVRALTLEAGLFFQQDPSSAFQLDRALAEQLTVSVLWTMYASALMFVGLRQRLPGVRWQGLALFGLTILKVFVSDFSFLSGFYRIGSSIALGVVLLLVSFLYQRKIAAARTQEPA